MIPLYRPHMPSLPELDQILHSGQLAYGKYAKRFERELEAFIGCGEGHVLVCNSFNMAVLVVISMLGIKAGDEVIASPMACLASTQPFATQEVRVKWADVDPATGTLCPEDVRRKITADTKAIIHNHFCGYVGYVEEINEIGRQFGIPVIDDCIEAFGSEYGDRRMGDCGTDITIFSFSAVRIPNTVDGGAILIRDHRLVEKGVLVRDCGIDRARFRDDLGEINPACDITLSGHSATMSNVNAYIGLEQMKCIDDILEKQRRQAEEWKGMLAEDPAVKVLGRAGTKPNYWVFGILAQDKREAIESFRSQGWHASGVHLNNNVYSIFGEQDRMPGVEEFYRRFVALPCGWWVREMREGGALS